MGYQKLNVKIFLAIQSRCFILIQLVYLKDVRNGPFDWTRLHKRYLFCSPICPARGNWCHSSAWSIVCHHNTVWCRYLPRRRCYSCQYPSSFSASYPNRLSVASILYSRELLQPNNGNLSMIGRLDSLFNIQNECFFCLKGEDGGRDLF